jgi:hypothetical protein
MAALGFTQMQNGRYENISIMANKQIDTYKLRDRCMWTEERLQGPLEICQKS